MADQKAVCSLSNNEHSQLKDTKAAGKERKTWDKEEWKEKAKQKDEEEQARAKENEERAKKGR